MLATFRDQYLEKKNNMNWDWLPCVYDFKQEYDGKEIIWNLSPYVMISSGESNVNISFS